MKVRQVFSLFSPLLRARAQSSHLLKFSPVFLTILLIQASLSFSSCQSPFSPVKDLDKIPETAIVEGAKISMKVYLWRDFMPGENSAGSDLMAAVELTAQNVLSFPNYLTADKIYVVYGNDSWEGNLTEVSRPMSPSDLNKISLRAEGGPKWPVGSQVDAVVRLIAHGSSYYLIKSSHLTIGASY
ncbi:MAG: hypothetical protein H5U07_05640 [Candidatus Aminicenantes bacterium]|nr:hypothetical protein [Candidatus Aminicenantes bacterium]